MLCWRKYQQVVLSENVFCISYYCTFRIGVSSVVAEIVLFGNPDYGSVECNEWQCAAHKSKANGEKRSEVRKNCFRTMNEVVCCLADFRSFFT
jgi:hypothetical protein